MGGPGQGSPGGNSATAGASGAQEATGAQTAPSGAAKGSGTGQLLIHQLEVMHQEVEKHLQGEGEIGAVDCNSAPAITDVNIIATAPAGAVVT